MITLIRLPVHSMYVHVIVYLRALARNLYARMCIRTAMETWTRRLSLTSTAVRFTCMFIFAPTEMFAP